MRSLATLGGVLVLIVLAIAWRISNTVDAGQKPDPNSGIVTLGIKSESDSDSRGHAAETRPTASAAGSSGQGTQAKADFAGTVANGSKVEDSGAGLNLPSNAPKSTTTGQEDAKPLDSSAQPEVETVPEVSSGTEGTAQVKYTTKEGDTLYRLLIQAYGKASPELIEAVALANDMDDPGALSLGQTLILPVVPGFQPPNRPK